MISLLFSYLLESSVSLILFAATYRLLIRNLTHFSWMRAYLLISLILSLLLPFVIIPVQWESPLILSDSFPAENLIPSHSTRVLVNPQPQTISPGSESSMILLFFTAFLLFTWQELLAIYGYKNVFKIEFILDSKNEVTGCLFTQREGAEKFGTYELIKQK